jgi:phenylpyruvate tautomerase PptA (4-oxalocrotonate tautomerase family)
MPFINIKTNIEITEQKLSDIKTKLGQSILLIPGKSESWLMLNFEEKCKMYFKGDNKLPIAFVEIKLYGKSNSSAYDKLTATVTKILNEELLISPSQIYVKYEECDHWGLNGNNF